MAKKNNNGDDKKKKKKSVTIRTWDIDRKTTPGSSKPKQTPAVKRSKSTNRSGVKVKRSNTSTKPKHKVTATEQVRTIPLPNKKGLPEHKTPKPRRNITRSPDPIPTEKMLGTMMKVSAGKGKVTGGAGQASKGGDLLGPIKKASQYAKKRVSELTDKGMPIKKAIRTAQKEYNKNNESRRKISLNNPSEAREWDKVNKKRKARVGRMGSSYYK